MFYEEERGLRKITLPELESRLVQKHFELSIYYVDAIRPDPLCQITT
jgi:hypothetical protein